MATVKGRTPPNKGMKLTSVERIERSQLIPGVRRTVAERRETLHDTHG
jgi:hypothetical protein